MIGCTDTCDPKSEVPSRKLSYQETPIKLSLKEWYKMT